jgi:hypothetical protein
LAGVLGVDHRAFEAGRRLAGQQLGIAEEAKEQQNQSVSHILQIGIIILQFAMDVKRFRFFAFVFTDGWTAPLVSAPAESRLAARIGKRSQ